MRELISVDEKKAIKQYLEARSLEPSDVGPLGWGLLAAEPLLEALKCSPADFPFTAALWVPHGEEAGQAIAPPELERNRATFTSAAARNKRNTKGALQLYIPPERAYSHPGDLYLCESCVKAAALWKRGYRAVSAAGVATLWTTTRGWVAGWEKIETLINAGEIRRARLLFDNDTGRNANVRLAADRVLEALRVIPGLDEVDEVAIPGDWGEKLGIDDCIVARGGATEPERAAWLDAFLAEGANVAPAAAGTRKEVMRLLNEQYATTVEPEGIVRLSSGYLTRLHDLKMVTGVLNWEEPRNGTKGAMVKRCAITEWVEWPQHNVVGKVDYLPGKPQLLLGVDGHYNQWTDTGCSAEEGPIDPFMAVYRNALGGDEVALTAFLDSMAWIMQNRGQKLPRTVYAVGAGHGTGKSALAYLMRDALGESNFCSISAEELAGDNNGSFITSELVLIDDAHGFSKKQAATLKRMATDDKVMFSQKYVKSYQVTNSVVFFLTANHLQALPLEDGDRRAIVLRFEPVVKHGPGSAHWKDYFSWLGNGGREAFRYHLENRDLSGFDPMGQIEGEGREEIIGGSLSDVDAWCSAVASDPEDMLGSDRKIWTTAELHTFIFGNAVAPSNRELLEFSKDLAQYFTRANSGKPVTLAKGKPVRFFAVAPHPDGLPWKGAKMIRAELERCGVLSDLLNEAS